MAAGSGSAPASGSESPPARREGLLPRRESLWLGEGWTKSNLVPPPLHPLPPKGGEIFARICLINYGLLSNDQITKENLISDLK